MDRQGADYHRVIAELQNNLKIPTLTIKDVIKSEDGTLSLENSKIDDIIEEISMVDDEVLDRYIKGLDIDVDLLA